MVLFEEINEAFRNKGCKFLMTEEEFNKNKHTTTEKYKYIASCGHEHIVWFHVFLNRNTGVICPKCIIANDSVKQKENASINPLKTLDLEYENIIYFRNLVKDIFDVSITREGCLADIAIKPKNIIEDSWLMIQVKSTNKPGRDYAFKCSNRYKDCIILCTCNSDKRMWALDGDSINVKNKIAIGLYKSKYSKFEITKENVFEKFKLFYDLYPKYEFNTINTPISKRQQLEYEYCVYRKEQLSFLIFEENEKQGLVYDFIVNGFKIQEKVGTTPDNKNGASFCLYKHDGKINFTSYKKGDNDFYWLNLPNKQHFYIIPEKELIDHGYLDIENKRMIYLNPKNKDHWSQKYLFDYTKPDIDKIKSTLNILN